MAAVGNFPRMRSIRVEVRLRQQEREFGDGRIVAHEHGPVSPIHELKGRLHVAVEPAARRCRQRRPPRRLPPASAGTSAVPGDLDGPGGVPRWRRPASLSGVRWHVSLSGTR
jgi:hypothetical protein